MGILFLLFVFGIALAIAQSAQRTSGAAWKAAAGHLRLQHTPGSLVTTPQLNGSVRGVAVRVEVLKRRGGGNGSTTTVFSVVHPSPAPPVQFKRQHAASFLRQFVGGRDVVVGDPRFDDSIVVDAADDAAIVAYLTPARRAAILSVFSTWRTVEVSDTGLSVSTPGRARDAAKIVSTVNRLVDTCRVLSDPEPLDTALGERDGDELKVSADALHELNARSDPNVVTQMLEAETLVATGESVRAIEIVEDVAERLPEDPEVDGWRDFFAASADAPTSPDPSGPSGPPEATETPDLDQQAVIDDLFADTRYGVSIDARYAEAYAARRITWTGTVENSRGYRSDADFGTDPGTKTTVAIGSVGSSRLMSNQVKAVVALPDGTKLIRGDTVTFSGTLLHVDRFTRKFYVSNGALV